MHNYRSCFAFVLVGWYEDSVFHVNGFGFPPTEPSSATRSVGLKKSVSTHLKKICGESVNCCMCSHVILLVKMPVE